MLVSTSVEACNCPKLEHFVRFYSLSVHFAVLAPLSIIKSFELGWSHLAFQHHVSSCIVWVPHSRQLQQDLILSPVAASRRILLENVFRQAGNCAPQSMLTPSIQWPQHNTFQGQAMPCGHEASLAKALYFSQST